MVVDYDFAWARNLHQRRYGASVPPSQHAYIGNATIEYRAEREYLIAASVADGELQCLLGFFGESALDVFHAK